MANQLYVMNVEALNDDFLARSAYDRLSKARKSKADLFVFRKDRNLSLGAGLLLDFALRSFGLHEKYVPGINAAGIPGSPSGACEFAVIDEYAKKDKRVKTTII